MRYLTAAIDPDEPVGMAAGNLARAVVALVQDRGGKEAVLLEGAVNELARRYPRATQASVDEPVELDPEAARELTDRELAKVLSGLVFGLCSFCDVEAVRRAVRWVAEKDEAWELAVMMSSSVSATAAGMAVDAMVRGERTRS